MESTLGHVPLFDAERKTFFAILWDADAYRSALRGADVEICDTGRFASCFELYGEMFDLQFGWEGIQIVGTNRSLVDVLTEQLACETWSHRQDRRQGDPLARGRRADAVAAFLEVERLRGAIP